MLTVSQIERRGKGRAIVHWQGFGSEWLHKRGRKWIMDSPYYGKAKLARLPREGDTI